jgi:hypothetical protein
MATEEDKEIIDFIALLDDHWPVIRRFGSFFFVTREEIASSDGKCYLAMQPLRMYRIVPLSVR